MYLTITHTTRPVNFDQCSLNYLTRRYSNQNRLDNPPPLESLSHEYLPHYIGDVTIWSVPNNITEKPELIRHLKKNYKSQHAVIHNGRLVICGTASIEICNMDNFETIHRYSDPWFSGGHTVFIDHNGDFVISCSASDAALILNGSNGNVKNIYRMPSDLYGFNYDLNREDDLRKYYINNDLQLTHINCAFPCDKGYLVSALIQGAIGLFDFEGNYQEITTGFVGCHGVRARAGLQGFYFTDSCNGNLVEMDWNGKIIRRFSVNSKWLHDCQWVRDDLYLFSLSDVNKLQLWDINTETLFWEIDLGVYGASCQFLSVSS